MSGDVIGGFAGESSCICGPRELWRINTRAPSRGRLTQEELAAMSGLDVRTISDIERGRTERPHRSTVDALARALDQDDLGYDAIRGRRLAVARVPGIRPAANGQVAGAVQKIAGPRLIEVFPVAIGHYADAGLTGTDTQVQVGRLIDLLAPFGGQHRPWKHPARGRGADAVQRRLREWASAPSTGPGSSVLYWAGHGWSDGSRIALAHAESPAAVGASGIDPRQLAEAIRERQAIVEARGEARDGGGWAMVIIEAGHATQIADAIMAELHGPVARAGCCWSPSRLTASARRAGSPACWRICWPIPTGPNADPAA